MPALAKSSAVFLALVVSVVTTGCSSSESGTAQPVGSSSPAASAPAPSSDAPSTAAIDPCSLFGPTDLGQFAAGFDGPQKSSTGDVRSCNYQKKTSSASDPVLVIGANVRDTAGVKDVNDVGSGTRSGTLDGRKSVEIPDGAKICTLAIGVTDTSRVDVLVTDGVAGQACDVAEKVADIVAPKLPKG
jgi:hypothetical protein